LENLKFKNIVLALSSSEFLTKKNKQTKRNKTKQNKTKNKTKKKRTKRKCKKFPWQEKGIKKPAVNFCVFNCKCIVLAAHARFLEMC